MAPKITPVILSGGSGTRLWPMSTQQRPKQFIPLIGKLTMFAETLARVSNPDIFRSPLIVSAEQNASLVKDELTDGSIILEPCPRGTAPAILLAALEAENEDDLLLVLASDHVVQNTDSFHSSIIAAAQAAGEGWLVCLGVQPTYPEIGYGYIEIDENEVSPSVKGVKLFTEKPGLVTATRYVSDGRHVWNAGIFLFRSGSIIDAIKTFDPELWNNTVQASQNAVRDKNIIRPAADEFEKIKSGSIDTIVFERANNVACAPVDMGWSDVGSWDALYDISSKNDDGNVLSGNVVEMNCTNTFIKGHNIPVAAYGLSNLIVVATDHGVIVLPLGESQQVKNLSEMIKRASEYNTSNNPDVVNSFE